ncbi:hypothetical protein PR202_gb22295 [Eleusine coracana subsp. coracana]|uniref:25S rRNA (uridine-N(3))-methyltransferase BMT5-like domain-containing protein n=1 Tax=Eleusine coracana subsp. coracana TaxID=191504 RepID=A0AAV5FD84_ELECO|nr:hypothetical protein PR202_gb22295 [Eleusine coracana subsp. coracana]
MPTGVAQSAVGHATVVIGGAAGGKAPFKVIEKDSLPPVEESILLVGDGDFSFSLALTTAFHSGANLVAMSLDTYGSFDRSLSSPSGS